MNYKHDCQECKFLGEFTPSSKIDQYYGKQVDLYYCPKGLFGFILFRYGNKPMEYIQCPTDSAREKENIFQSINEAYKLHRKTNK
jgi:hypothetical protein